jgi:hypothetical protein
VKDLISIFNYSPDNRRKDILNNLLNKLQPFRNNFDLMVVSHSAISDLSLGLIDYFFYDENNELINDFNLTNKFWFRSPEMAINSSLVYPVSTHLAIYKLFYYVFNFAFHKKYKKIHFIEFDVELKDFDLINQVNKDLDEHDAVMFHGRDEWALGVYFASTLNGFTSDRFEYDREKILSQLSESDSRMTERVTPVILCRDRKVKFREFIDLNDGNDCQKNDEHNNGNLKWAVPIVLRGTNEVSFFIYNEVGTNHVVDLFINNRHIGFEVNQGPGIWSLTNIGDLNDINEMLIFVDKVLLNKIILNESNKQKFADNNFIVYLNNED